MTIVAVTIAGSIGALGRYVLTGFIQARSGSSLPVGTAVVNLLGAFALGMVIGAEQGPALASSTVAGFLAGFTTFSTWMVETARLGVVPRPGARAVINLTVLAGLGVASAALGYYLTG